MFYISFFLFKKMSDSLIPSFLMSDVSESQVAHQKLAMWENRSGRSTKKSDHERFAQRMTLPNVTAMMKKK